MVATKWFQRQAGLHLVFCLLISGCYTASTTITSSTSPAELSNVPPPTPPNTLPELIAVLSSQNAEARIGAARALAAIGPTAETAVPSLTQNLYYTNSDVRKAECVKRLRQHG